MKRLMLIIILPMLITTVFCTSKESTSEDMGSKEIEEGSTNVQEENNNYVNPQGATIKQRFIPPKGFERIVYKEHTFAHYLQNLPLKADSAKVYNYDGSLNPTDGNAAVLDIDVGTRNLQQCADAVMRLRAEYLLKENKINDIHFKFVNGFDASYAKWLEGYRIKVNKNKCTWVKSHPRDTSYKTFRKYLDMVFAYAGTASLVHELKPVDLSQQAQVGDVLIQGGSPGHAVIIVDMVINQKNNERLYLLAQSYMPAQSIHILKNFNKDAKSPWYSFTKNSDKSIITYSWVFLQDDLKRF